MVTLFQHIQNEVNASTRSLSNDVAIRLSTRLKTSATRAFAAGHYNPFVILHD